MIKQRKCADRTGKQIKHKIAALEQQFRAASDWIANNGDGLDNPGDMESHVKVKLCPLHCDLENVMSWRPNARPLGANEDDFAEDVFPEEDNGAGTFECGPSDDEDPPLLDSPAGGTPTIVDAATIALQKRRNSNA